MPDPDLRDRIARAIVEQFPPRSHPDNDDFAEALRYADAAIHAFATAPSDRYDYICANGHPFATPAAPHGGPWSTLVCQTCGASAHLQLCWECATPTGHGHTAECVWGEKAA